MPFPAGSYPARVVADGASYYWRLGEPSGTTAVDSIGGVNGTISGGVTLAQAGALSDGDKAMTFNGTTGQILTPAESVTIQAVCSIEAWMKTTAVGVQRPAVSARLPGGFATLLVYFGKAATGAARFYANAEMVGVRAINDGLWHHIVGVNTATDAFIYVDGVLDATQARIIPADTGQLALGYDLVDIFGWNGSLDDVAIYPLALTPAQVSAHYVAGTQGGARNSLFRWWPLQGA